MTVQSQLNECTFIGLNETVMGAPQPLRIRKQLVDQKLAESRDGYFLPTLQGYTLWREYRLVPGRITPAQATLLEAHWRDEFAGCPESWSAYIRAFEAMLRLNKPYELSVIQDVLLLEEDTAKSLFGNEAFGPYTRWA